ncbi:hypothetical protein BDF14DRAFT_1993885 [Spinellus fusiger]|nr:hypothetical protein BDF14DRAFT_1993885 [Spinellus fusiger]
MHISFASIISSSLLAASFVAAKGQIAQVVDASNFCIFLPPTDSTDRSISNTEWEGNAFCMGSTPKAVGAEAIPSGLIQSAHFVATDAYVQVTGQIDPTKGNLDPKDDGGQFDVRAPIGSSCAGWQYYVNLIEPVNNVYCMRCCNDTVNCNRGISQKGCARVIPGDFSGPMSVGGAAPAAPPTTPTTPTVSAAPVTHTTVAAAPVASSAAATPAASSSSAAPAAHSSSAAASNVAATTSASSSPSSSSSSSSAAASSSSASPSAQSSQVANSHPLTTSSVNGANSASSTSTSNINGLNNGSISAQSVSSGAGITTPNVVALAAVIAGFGILVV